MGKPMSDKPTLSEIRARCPTTADYIYLVDLLSRMGKALSECRCSKKYCGRIVGEAYAFEDCIHCKEARALIEEIKL